MPELSRFFGIVIRMFSEHNVQHHVPHFHAYYQDDAATFRINPVEHLGGSLPLKQQRLVEAWAELHQDQLQSNWKRLQDGQPPLPISPLQ